MPCGGGGGGGGWGGGGGGGVWVCVCVCDLMDFLNELKTMINFKIFPGSQ